MDTICALSSGPPPSGVAVIRLSGPASRTSLEAMVGSIPPSRRAVLRRIRDPEAGELIDEGIVLWLPGPETYTGEDCAELQCHGSRAVIQGIIDALVKLPGVRLAEAGEFSRRAFDNGRLDLTELEGLADLIHAETEAQRWQAARLAQGHMRRDLERWREELIALRADVEVRLDFSDEDDVDVDVPAEFQDRIGDLKDEVEQAIATFGIGERVRRGFRVAIMGPPNAGKSTLLNRIAKRDIAIVTHEAGTTRDVLEVPLDLDGYPVVLFDTAGLRDTENIAEQEGIRRARDTGELADLVLWLRDLSAEGSPVSDLGSVPIWKIGTKADLRSAGREFDCRVDLAISAFTGEGLDVLIDRLRERVCASLASEAGWLVTRERQRNALNHAVSRLEGSDAWMARPLEMIAEDLRVAGDAIGRVTGRIDVEDVLDRLFGEFCIGK